MRRCVHYGDVVIRGDLWGDRLNNIICNVMSFTPEPLYVETKVWGEARHAAESTAEFFSHRIESVGFAAGERSFSNASHIQSRLRTCLSYTTLHKLLYVYYNFRVVPDVPASVLPSPTAPLDSRMHMVELDGVDDGADDRDGCLDASAALGAIAADVEGGPEGALTSACEGRTPGPRTRGTSCLPVKRGHVNSRHGRSDPISPKRPLALAREICPTDTYFESFRWRSTCNHLVAHQPQPRSRDFPRTSESLGRPPVKGQSLCKPDSNH